MVEEGLRVEVSSLGDNLSNPLELIFIFVEDED